MTAHTTAPSPKASRAIYAYALSAWIVLILLTLTLDSALIAAVAIGYTGLLPFLIAAIWISRLNERYKLSDRLNNWLSKIVLTWLLFSYAAYAQKWAASTINEIFSIDASQLGITYMVLAAFFTPFGLLYQGSLMGLGVTTITIVAMIGVTAVAPLLVSSISLRKLAKGAAVALLVLALCLVFFSIGANIARDKAKLIKSFAVWADFNSHHLCSDDWTRQTSSVVFLGGDKVLAYHPYARDGQFKVQTCNFRKAFD
ncbi:MULTISPECIES: hypothetical protein [unclassified Pseudomonas]|uniref:hypothetical protein n=1 Tax=unclassified Pseudomonas TaxID=196821 RepID=UPI00244D22FA|nr:MULTISPECIES: hypothetical protein [unclassified Pseudomonas]MDH0303611.1 hypothetical protein [Pseudomonas sp. GD04091]MDH1987060.1 hypothetical protein [Pseudomonas sp. GD03689]